MYCMYLGGDIRHQKYVVCTDEMISRGADIYIYIYIYREREREIDR